MRAHVVDQAVLEFAPDDHGPGLSHYGLVGDPDTDVAEFAVVWRPQELGRVMGRPRRGGGIFVAYLGGDGRYVQWLVARSLAACGDIAARFVSPDWRFHSLGVVAALARSIGIKRPAPVLPLGIEHDYKLVTFVPERSAAKVRNAIFAAGGGRYDDYSKCSFSSVGKGTFFGEQGTRPAVGNPERLEEVAEVRLEVIVPNVDLGRATEAARRAHPYERPVVEAHEIGSGLKFGEGRIGRLESPAPVARLKASVARLLGSPPAFFEGRGRVSRVMLWDGEPYDGLFEAASMKIDLYIGPDSGGLAALASPASNVLEFPKESFMMAGANRLMAMVKEKSKLERWSLRTFAPSRARRKG